MHLMWWFFKSFASLLNYFLYSLSFIMWSIVIVWCEYITFSFILIADAQFINNANNITECSGGTASFSWTYATSTPVLFVEWKKDESSIALETGGTFAPEAPYVGRLTKISNAHVSLGSLSVADSGIYKSEVTYTDGNAYASNSVSLVVYGKALFNFYNYRGLCINAISLKNCTEA